jgi:hypothetical protein
LHHLVLFKGVSFHHGQTCENLDTSRDFHRLIIGIGNIGRDASDDERGINDIITGMLFIISAGGKLHGHFLFIRKFNIRNSFLEYFFLEGYFFHFHHFMFINLCSECSVVSILKLVSDYSYLFNKGCCSND